MFNQLLDGLKMIVVKHTSLSKSMAKRFVELVYGMIDEEAVKHKMIALAVKGKTVGASIRTTERWFLNNYISSQDLGFMIYDLLKLWQYGRLTIILDRTDWFLGTKCINIFAATVVIGNFSIPIALEVFGKEGATNTADRKALLNQVIALIGLANIEVVLADREFVGEHWMTFLYENKISFVIRIRNNFYIEYKGARVLAAALFNNLGKDEYKEFKVKLGGLDVRLAATLAEDGELVMVVSPRYFRGRLLDRYRTRWLIELYFKSIKTMGFNLEDTHMTDPDKIKTLMALIAVASAIALMAGRFRTYVKKIPIKAHGRPQYTTFTYGLDLLRAILKGRTICWPFNYSAPKTSEISEPWSNWVDLLLSFILGYKFVGY